MTDKLIVAIDSGTSMVKAVAFTTRGETVATASRPNRFSSRPGGEVDQDMARSWDDACAVLRDLAGQLAGREIAALAITGQGDGTWLIDDAGEPVGAGWIWLDSRAGDIVEHLRENGAARAAFAYTGTGLAACQQSSQLLWMERHAPEALSTATTSMHCKDYLYFRATGVRATDPAEACFTFGDYRTRGYRDEVLLALGLSAYRRLLPPIVDGTQTFHPMTRQAAAATGLAEGTPVVLGYIDTVCTALGAGLYGGGADVGVTILGSTGMHLRLVADPDHVAPSPAMTGYCKPFPVPGYTMVAQTNMAATLNIDWIADVAREAAEMMDGASISRRDVLQRLDARVCAARPGAVLYHPYISTSGERGPFTDGYARAGMFGLDQTVGIADLARGVYEGLALASRDCYVAMGGVPAEVRLSGGAARSRAMRQILAACLDRPVSCAAQDEAGAAGAAMIACVSLGLFADMAECAAVWVAPSTNASETPDRSMVETYDALYPIYVDARAAMPGLWRRLHAAREHRHVA